MYPKLRTCLVYSAQRSWTPAFDAECFPVTRPTKHIDTKTKWATAEV